MNHCPNCGNQVDPSWKRCGFCGQNLTVKPPANEQLTPPVITQDLRRYLPYAGIALVALIAVIVVLLLSNNSQKNSPSTPADFETPGLLNELGASTNESQIKVNETPNPAPTFIIVTATPEIKPTETKTPTPGKTCPDTFAPRVSIGDRAIVCTKRDRLIVRVEPDKGEREIARIYPGTFVKILKGPECADKSSWWWVQVSKGTTVYYANLNLDDRIDEDLFGWVREGGDTEDRYYLCKIED